MAQQSRSDVVIIGCGPVGAALALFLRAQGFEVVVVERHRTMYHLPRAVMLGDDTRRAFQHLHLEEHLEPLTTAMYGAEFVDADHRRLFGMDGREGELGPLGHPRSSMFHQPDIDQLLRTVGRERGVSIRLGATVTRLEQDDDEVSVRLDDGSTIRAQWAIGCDGATSAVREFCGIGTVDLGFDQEWLVVDIDAWNGFEARLPRIAQQICDPDRPATFVPGHAHHLRWEFQLQPGETALAMEDPAKVWELVAPWMGPSDGSLIRAVVYRFHAMVAESMRQGRVFLAGDSAHQMPPFLGQGLNTGFRDAANLAWKLAMVRSGVARDGLLDTYGTERLPHARGVVEHAADVGRLIDQLAGRASHAVDESSGYGGGRPFPHLEAGAVVGEHRSVGRPFLQARTEGGFTDDVLGPGCNLAVAGEGWVVPSPLASVISRPVAVDPELLAGAGAVVVRPDFIVAAAADTQHELDSVGDELARRLALS